MSSKSKQLMRPQRRYIVLLVVLAFAIYVIMPQLGDFRDTLQQLRHPETVELLLGVSAAILTYFAAAATYCLLAFKPLRYGSTLLVQLASVFVNRLLPGGIGALSVNYLYLKRSKHTVSEGAAIITLNNAVGMLGHGLLLLLILLFSKRHLPGLHLAHVNPDVLGLIAAGGGAVLMMALLLKRQSVATGLQRFGHELARFRHRKLRLAGALATSMCVTLLTVAGLWFCLSAVHVHVAFITVFVVFSVGFSAGTAIPTPGGLGGVEAGLVAGLVAYNVPSAAALAGVLLYRLLTYWFALILGAMAFGFAQHRALFKV